MIPNDDDRARLLEDIPVSGNLFALIIGLFSVVFLAASLWTSGLTKGQANDAPTLSRCATISDAVARLACFDKLAAPQPLTRGPLVTLRNHPNEQPQ